MGDAPWFERISANDAQQLATDVGPVPMNVGAVLLLGARPHFDVGGAQKLLALRLAAVPRLRQRIVVPPFGCGRPVWVDDPGFDVAAHLGRIRCPSPGDDAALMDLAVTTVTRALDRSRPLWRAAVVTGLAGGQVGMVFAFHHVLADGIGGLAVLAGLVDESASGAVAGPGPSPRPAPSRGMLFADANTGRWRSLRRLPLAATQMGAALSEMGRRPASAPRTSLNTATGPRRSARVVRTDLQSVRDAARARSGTVNDVMLAAAAGALRTLLESRGERQSELVVSVPVTARTAAAAGELGNRAGVMPVRVPLGRPAGERLDHIARTTAAQKASHRGASAAVVAPIFRLMAAVGVFRWTINRQRVVNTFLTNVRGPDRPLSFHGAPISRMVPITIAAGNVTIAFAVFSYAGTLTVTVVVDPDAVPDADVLVSALDGEIRSLVGG